MVANLKIKRKLDWKTNFITYIVVSLLAFSVFLFFNNLTGNIIYNQGNYTGTDFAPPFDVFNNNSLIFNISPENLSLPVDSVNFSIVVSYPSAFIYRKAYFYNNYTLKWESFNFTQQTIGNSSWIYGSVNLSLSIPSGKLIIGNNLFAVYACKKISDRWECGCQNNSQTNCRRWMLQIVNVSVNSTPNAFSGGDGTSGNPYQITTWAQLNNTRLNLSASYILMNNLNSSSVGYVGIGNNWIPIGNHTVIFKGNFNGQGYVISDLISYVPLDGRVPVGLFGSSSGNLSNIALNNVNITGRLVAWSYDEEVGGLVGHQINGLISNSYVTGRIYGYDHVGGLVGHLDNSRVNSSYSIVNVSGSNAGGGLIGFNRYSTITNSYALGSVNVGSHAGGLVGYNLNGVILNSYSAGNITPSGCAFNCNGFVGTNSGGAVYDSYYNRETSGKSDTGKGEPKTTTQMKTLSTFGAWNISYSNVNLNNNYPYLGWQIGNNSYIWLINNPFKLTSCGTIFSPGNYTLMNNISTIDTCFNITSDNVTLDLGGYTISGDDNGRDLAIYITKASNVNVFNGILKNFGKTTNNGYGIRAENVTNSTFSNLKLDNNFYGILLANSSYNTLTNISGIATSYLAYLTLGSAYNICNNITSISSFYTGVRLQSSNYNTFYNIYSYNSSSRGIYLGSSNFNEFYNLTSINDSVDSIWFASSTDNVFYNANIISPTAPSVGDFNSWAYSLRNRLVFYNSYGQINFSNFNTNVDSDIKFGVGQPIQISNNSVFVNFMAIPELNNSATITLYNISKNMLNPKIMKDGAICNDCYNLTSLNAGNVIFNVSNGYSFYIMDIDQTAPNATIISPQNETITNQTSVNFTANVSDNAGLANATFNIYNSSGLFSQIVIALTGVVQTTTQAVVNLVEGVYSWFLNVADLAGNIFSTQNNTLIVDVTSPKLSILSPLNMTYFNKTILVTINATDSRLDKVWFNWNGSNQMYTTPIYVTFSEGINTIYIYANDTAGNVNSTSVRFNVTILPPLFAGGLGTSNSPYQISSWTHLNNIKTNLSAYYVLLSNLSSSSAGYSGLGNNWSPIGNNSYSFAGNFDGKNNSVSNLTINLPSSSNVGLFGFVIGNISNLRLINVNVTGFNSTGGLVGYQNGGTVFGSYTTGKIKGNLGVGGLVGYQARGTISSSYSAVNITGVSYIGGLTGYSAQIISNCYSRGSVNGTSIVGGLVGQKYNGTIFNSYSTGKVTGSSSVGGLIGVLSSGTITSSYWDSQTSGQSKSAGGTGWVTASMLKQSTYVGWNFTNTWAINSSLNNGYPYLRWER